jgi:hypothetical protein
VVSETRPLEKLAAFAREMRSGEFICAASSLEVHVYLQEGRIAWATDSAHPLAFSKHLQETTDIDAGTLKEVVLSCRKEKLPLGETLVEWGIASWEQVRDSLFHQVAQAIAVLDEVEGGQAVFLERAYARYDEKLTFALEAFVSEATHSPPVRAEMASPAGMTLPADGAALARRIRGSIDGLAWVDVFDGTERIGRDPADGDGRSPAGLAVGLIEATVLDGVDFVAFRSPRGCLVGLGALGEATRSAWCEVAADSTFGGIVSALVALTGRGGSGDDASLAPPPSEAAWSLGPDGAPMAAEIGDFVSRAEELLGAIVLDGEAAPRVGAGRTVSHRDRFLQMARQRSATLGLWQGPSAAAAPDTPSTGDDAIAFSLKTMVTGEPGVWCFGAQLHPDSAETLWAFVDRRMAQGLGWAYLNALARVVGKAGGGA